MYFPLKKYVSGVSTVTKTLLRIEGFGKITLNETLIIVRFAFEQPTIIIKSGHTTERFSIGWSHMEFEIASQNYVKQ